MREIDPLIHYAVSVIHNVQRPGHLHSLTLEQRVKLLLIKRLAGELNRMFVVGARPEFTIFCLLWQYTVIFLTYYPSGLQK